MSSLSFPPLPWSNGFGSWSPNLFYTCLWHFLNHSSIPRLLLCNCAYFLLFSHTSFFCVLPLNNSILKLCSFYYSIITLYSYTVILLNFHSFLSDSIFQSQVRCFTIWLGPSYLIIQTSLFIATAFSIIIIILMP